MNTTASSDAFTGERIHYKKFRHAYLDKALNAIDGNPQGVIGAVIPEEDFEDLFGCKFILLTSKNPPADLGADPSEKEIAQYKMADSKWKYNEAKFIKQEAGIKAVRDFIIANLDQHSKDLFTQGTLGAMHFSLKEMVERLNEEYGTLTPTDMDQLMKKATAIFKGGHLRNFLLEIEVAYADLEANGEFVPTGQKLRNLNASLKNSPVYLEFIQRWGQQYQTVVQQKKHYPRLIESLKMEYDKIQSTTSDDITVQNRHMVNEVTKAPVTMDDLFTGMAAYMSQQTGTRPTPAVAAIVSKCKTCGKNFSAGVSKKGVHHAFCTECFAKRPRAPARAHT